MPKTNNIDFNLNFRKGDVSGLESLKKDLAAIKSQVSNPNWAIDSLDLKKIIPTINTLQTALSKAFDPQLNTINIQKFNQILTQSGLNARTLQQNLSLAGTAGNQAFLKLTSQMMQFNVVTKQSNKFLDTLATSFFNTLRWTALSGIVHGMGSEIQKAYYYVKDLDRSLNDIRIVTSKNADEMEKFAESANKAAKQLAVTTKDYTQGSLIYYQQGLNDETVKTLTDITAMTSNVTGQSMSTVSEELTAVWNGYQVANQAAEEGMTVYQEYVDKMAAVGATTASDLQELSVAMSKVASAASSMGVNFDDLTAQIATIVSVTRQAPESVGTALKTIYARLGDLKVDGVDEFGTKLGEVSSQMQTMGVNILDTNGDMRDMSSVMAEVAEKWNTWTSAQKQAAAVAMAGKRQYNNLVALFDNWDMYGEALETSMEAAGTLEKQQEIALDSLANKMDILSATTEDFYDSLLDENSIKTLVEGLTKVVQLLADFSDATGGLNNLLPLLGATAFRVFNAQIAEGLSTVIINARNAKAALSLENSNAQLLPALQAQFANSNINNQGYSNPNEIAAQEQAISNLNKYYSEMVQYRSIMNKEEKESYNTILNMTEEVGSLSIKLESQKNHWLATHQTLQKIINQNYIKDIGNHTDDVQKKVLEINQTIVGLEEELKKVSKTEVWSKDQLNTILQGFDGGLGGSRTSGDISKVIQRFGQLNGATRPVKEVLEIIIKELKQVGDGANDLVKVQNQMESTKLAADQFGESLRQNLDLKLLLTNVTTAIGAVGQLASSISMLSNIGNIWNNEDLQSSEKFLQIITNAGMALPILINSLSKLNEIMGVTNFLTIAFSKEKAKEIALTTVSTVQEEIENRLLQKYAILKGISVNQISASMRARIADNAAIQAEALATDKAASATWRLNAALSANPLGLIAIALTAVISLFVLYEKYQEKIIEQAKEKAKLSQEEANNLKQETDANKELIASYEEIYNKYKQGQATKEELYNATDKLIEAYDIEATRLDLLAGKYDAVTDAIYRKRNAELETQKSSNQTAMEDTLESVFTSVTTNKNGDINISGSDPEHAFVELFENTGKEGTQLTNEQGSQVLDKIWEIFGEENLEVGESGLVSFKLDKNNIGDVLNFYEKLIEYQRWLRDNGFKDYEIDERVNRIKKELNVDNSIDEMEQLRNDQTQIITEQAGLDRITSKEDFSLAVENIRQELSKIYDEDEIDDIMMKILGQVNTSLGKNFYIDEVVRKQLGEEVLNALQNSNFYKYDKATQSAILGFSFDWSKLTSGNSEEVRKAKEAIDAYAKLITGNENGMYAVPVSFQDQINDTVLKGKDINKDDWTTMQANLSPEANQILGDREEFNNKSIGERIALLEQVNELTLQNNLLAIQEYDENKKRADLLKESLKEQKIAKEAELAAQKNILNWARTPEQIEKAKEKIKEIEEELKQISSNEYQIDISLDMDKASDNYVQSLVGDVMTEADQIKAAAESISEGWTVAAEDVATFAAAFPELMDGMKRQADGSLQLSKEIVNTELQGAQERINANKQVAIEAAEDKIKQLKLELQLQEEEKRILEEALNGQKTKAETEKALKDAVTIYEKQLLKEGLISQADAINKANFAAKEGTDSMINVLSGVNDAINIIHSNFANMLTLNPLQAYNAVAGAISNVSAGDINTNIDASFNDDDINAMIARVGELDSAISKTKTQIASYEGFVSEMMNSVTEADKAADRVQKGLAGKEPKNSKSGKDKDKELKKLDEEFDRYWEIHKALDQIDRDLKKIDKDQQNLYGKELIRSLKQENELLNNQAQLYEQLAAAQEAEAAELRGQLAASGVVFDASGAVLNYAEATAAALKAYNDAVQAYNAGLLDDAAFKIHEKAFEEFKKALERYDTLFYQEMKETQEKLDDIRREILANNLKAWEVEIQLKLDFKQLRRDWNDFLNEVSEDFQSVFKDLRVDMKNMLDDAKTYIGKEGTINTIIKAVHDVTKEIDKMMGGGESDMFESVSQAQEKLKELNEQLLDAGKALHDLWKEAWDSYLEGIDQTKDQFDELMERFERINDELEFQKKLIEVLYGDEAYGLMSEYYTALENNNLTQMQSLKQQVDFWKEEFDKSGASINNFTEWSEDQQKYYDNWIEAQKKLDDMTLDYIDILKNDYLNTLKSIIKEYEMAMTNGKGFTRMDEEWERISTNADKYYDSVEGAYQIQTLANKIDKSIADSNNLAAQQKLVALREREIKYLREKENLTEYDIKAAELRYQLALREIALEDAQQNKTGMKLTRNEEGNWSYQYVADEEDILSKRQELLDTYNQLYQLASDAYEANLEAAMKLEEEYTEKLAELEQQRINGDETALARIAELEAWHEQQVTLLKEENQLYRNDLAQSGAMLLKTIYEQDEEAVLNMTDAERELIQTLVENNIDDYMAMQDAFIENYDNIGTKAKEVMAETRADWKSGAQELVENFKYVEQETKKAYDAIENANQKYQDAVDVCAEVVGRDFDNISEAIQRAQDETDTLKDKTVEMVETSHGYLDDLRSYVDQVAEAWRNVQNQIKAAIDLIDEYLRKVGEANVAAQQEAAVGGAGGGGTGTGGNGDGNEGSKTGQNPSGEQKKIVGYQAIGADGNGTTSFIHTYSNHAEAMSAVRSYEHGSVARIFDDGSRKVVYAFKTGGYTGSWGDTSGRLAMLHQKELVLNADDTKNFLSGINMIRQLSSGLNGSIENAVLKAVANTALSLGGITSHPSLGSTVSNNNSTDNVFNITAEFPNANNVDDIRQAILSLPNIASQYVNSNLR